MPNGENGQDTSPTEIVTFRGLEKRLIAFLNNFYQFGPDYYDSNPEVNNGQNSADYAKAIQGLSVEQANQGMQNVEGNYYGRRTVLPAMDFRRLCFNEEEVRIFSDHAQAVVFDLLNRIESKEVEAGDWNTREKYQVIINDVDFTDPFNAINQLADGLVNSGLFNLCVSADGQRWNPLEISLVEFKEKCSINYHWYNSTDSFPTVVSIKRYLEKELRDFLHA